MKQVITLSMLIALGCSFVAIKTKPFTPPGTVPITEVFFADETEVTNQAWREYESWTRIKYGYHSPEHLATLPDTLVWRNKETHNEPYAQYYYRHSAYKDYPVVGVSYEQALAFCQWRTERVKEWYAIRNKKELHISYRLPSKDEWELLSNNDATILAGKNAKNEITLNCARPQAIATDAEHADVTAPAYSYWANRFGLYNTFGNVSEMVSEKGISKGGSWRHTLESCRTGKDIAYSGATSWLGFRCVCDMKN